MPDILRSVNFISSEESSVLKSSMTLFSEGVLRLRAIMLLHASKVLLKEKDVITSLIEISIFIDV